MTDSSINYDKDGRFVGVTGKDGVSFYAAAVLCSSIRLYLKSGIIPTRGMNMKRMNELATRYTGQPYKGRKGAEQAVLDLEAWVQTMKAALPHDVRE